MRCSAITRVGVECQASAVHGSNPPLCSAHLGRNAGAGAPAGNQNHRKHGFYGRYYTSEELEALQEFAADDSLDSEIGVVRVALRRALRVLEDESADPLLVAALTPLVFAGGRTVARLLRDRRLLSGEDADTIMREIAEALDSLGEEWGVRL
jgi:hypothetical protein